VKFTVALSCLVLSLAATSTAQAHFLYHHKNLPLDRKISYFKRSVDHDQKAIVWYRKVQRNLRNDLRALAESRYEFSVAVHREIKFHKVALRWHKALLRRYQAKWDKLHPRHLSEWLCIHKYEGSWTDDGAPYYGGLQMDLVFQQHYGKELLKSKGTANNWTPLEQMMVAEKAYSSGRGFYPWPNTARYCGLI
jgi:hypothetical protein